MAKTKEDRKTKQLERLKAKEEKKLLRKKKIEEEAKTYKKEKELVPKKTNFFLLKLELLGAYCITILDLNMDKILDWFDSLGNRIESVAARFIMHLDYAIDVTVWFVVKYFVLFLRGVHNLRVYLNSIRRRLVRGAIGCGVVGIALTIAYGSVIDYEYAYNGQVLGIVNDQNEVVDILEMVSEGLSEEYNAAVTIEAGRDISFRPVVSIDKDIDKADDVLRKFSYLNEVRVDAYGIFADGEFVVALDTEKRANDAIQGLIKLYVNDKDDYESIEFVENVEVKPIQTTLDKITNKQSAIEYIQTSNIVKAYHTIAYGDTLENICARYNMTLEKLYELNPTYVDKEEIKIDDQVIVETVKPFITLITVRVATIAESIPFETEYVDSSQYYLDTYLISQEGVEGKRGVTARIKEVNGEVIEKEELKSEVLIEPIPRIISHGTKPIPPREGTGTFIRPVTGYQIGSRFGLRIHPVTGEYKLHTGIDLQIPYGTPIHASDGGVVIQAGWNGSYGYSVMIDHGGLFTTLYGHNSKLLVEVGDKVYQDQVIALAGSTGASTGSHCHFEILYDGEKMDPENYLSF